MKRETGTIFLCLILLLTACTGGRRAEMQQRLQALNALNRADSVLTATNRDEAQLLVDYFDRHGTSNEQLLAHYLVGRCYADMHEAPMALHCYQEAIRRADTTAADCDYAQLSRVYGQSAAIFYQQGLYRNMLDYLDKSEEFGLKGKDTLNALLSYVHKALVYEQLQLKDSSILVYQDAIKKLRLYKYNKVAAGVSGGLAEILVNKGDALEAEPYLLDYERNSGYFDFVGNVVKGREMFYYAKGLYFLKTSQLDSAEYYFRKELRIGRDFNNQRAGAYGLSLLYQQKNNPDSTAKYALYYSEMNDSCFAQKATHKVEQAKAMYDYSRHQEKAKEEKERADRQTIRLLIVCVATILLLVVLGVVGVLFYLQQKKRKLERARYNELLRQLKNAQSEIVTLREHEAEFHRLIDKKESDITDQDLDDSALKDTQAEVEQLREKEKQLSMLVKEKQEAIIGLQTQLAKYEQRQSALLQKEYTELEKLSNVSFYRDLIDKSNKGTLLLDDDWNNIDALVKKELPEFYEFLTTKKNYLDEKEYKVCLLTRLHFQGKTSAAFIGIAPSYITKYRKDLHVKLFQGDNDSKAFVSLLNSIG